MENTGELGSLPPFLATAVGSLPHEDPSQAVDLILGSLDVAPHIPQLSRANLKELMWTQCTEGLPRFRVDSENLSYYFDTSGDPSSEIEEFYTAYLEVMEGGSAEAFAISPEYGMGIHCLLERLRREPKKRRVIKVQVSGPLSFSLTVTDEAQRAIFYHSIFRDIAVKGMGLKAVWLLEQFKPLAENVIVFFDEPSLSAYGSSAWLAVSRNDVIESLDDVISMVLERGGIPGVHCCGNTDWGLLMETSTRIINFDAVDYMESVSLYQGQLIPFLSRGGALAWGAVPNTEKILDETADSVIDRIRNGMALLEKSGVDRTLLRQRMLVTPACGCASITVEQSERVYQILSELQRRSGTDIFGR
jgi:hypothetical protein